MRWQEINEAFGTTETLFHGSNLDNLWLIVKDGKLTPDAHGRGYDGPTGVCLSRSYKVAHDHAGSWAETLNSSFFEYFGLECREGFSGTVIFEFDRSKITNEIVPFNDFGHGVGDDGGEEEEERVIGDLSLDAAIAFHVRKGEIEEFLEHAVEAHKKHDHSTEYNDEFRSVITKVLTDPRLRLY